MGPERTESPPIAPSGADRRAPGAPRRRGGWLLRAIVIAVTSVLLVIVGTVTALTFLFQTGSPFLSSRIMSILNQAVAADSTRFVSDRVHGTLFRGAIVENPRLLVRTPTGEMTWARAKTLRVDYDLVGLAMGRGQDFRVEIEKPFIDLLHDARGEMVLPKFARRRAGGRPSQEVRVEITLRDGGFALDRNDIRFGSVGGHAVLVIGPEKSSLRLDRVVGVSRTPGRPGRLGLNGDLTIDAGVLRAHPLDITLGRSRLTAAGGWDLAEARVIDGRVDLHPLELQEFFRSFKLQSPEGTVRGEVTFSGTPTAGQARACLEGTYAGETIDTLVVVARSRVGAVDFSDLRMLVHRAEITGGGTLHTQGLLTADLGFRDVDPANVPWWTPPEGTPRGDLNGRVRLTARRIAPKADATLALSLGPSRVGKVAIERGEMRLVATPDGGATFDSSWIQVPGGILSARGRLGADRAIAATVNARVQELGRLNPLLGPMAADSGSGRIEGRLTGTLDDPRFTAQAHLFHGRFANGLGGDTLLVEAQGILRPELDLTADVGIKGLSLKGRRMGDLDATVTGGRTLHVQRFRQSLGDTVLSMRGEVTFGSLGSVSARVDSLSLTAGEHRVRNRGPIRLAHEGEHLRVNDLVLELDPGTLIADLDWNPARNTVDFRGRVEGVELSRLPELRRRQQRIAGLVQGDLLASGSFSDPEVALRLVVVEPTIGEFTGDSLVADLDYVPGVLTVQRAAWSSEGSRLSLSGSLRPSLPLQEWTRALAKRDRAWASRAALALSVEADSFDLGILAPADTALRSLEGIASLRARIGGTAEAPVLDLTAAAPRIRYRGVDGVIPGIEIAYQSRRLLVNRFEVRQDDAASQIRGELPLDLSFYAEDRLVDDRPLALAVDIPNGDLSIARLLFPEIGTSSGAFGASARLSGTWAHPRVTGTAKVSNGRLRLAGREEVIDRIVLDATFDETQLTIANAVGRQGEKGRIQASGTWRWPSGSSRGVKARFGPPGEYRFRVATTEFAVTDRENYYLRLNGEFDIESARHPQGGTVPKITGRTTVTKGELTLDLSKPSTAPGEPAPFLYYITVDVPGNFFYRNLDAEVELEAQSSPIIFRNEGAGDLALGVLEVRSGKYYVATREFRNLQGTVNFNNPDRIDAEVNIVGETSLPTPEGTPATVYLSLTDRMSRLKVTVYDDVGTPPNELWKALAFGQFVRGYSVSSSESSNPEASVMVPISNYLFQNVERWLGSSGFIDTIDLRGGGAGSDAAGSGNTPISAFGVGKYVTPELYFKYSREFSGETDEQIGADYRVSRHLLLKGQQVRDLSGTEPTEYNLDLKIRLEY
ncbi:MAG TPA: translocation/assembly module TamB domain-containing protein [Candidatus Eisenbacteria bacterium]|nr:translocation/assembly module TamB domain-containing protein [Candidatus Eisenbacteria bacterium]